MARKYTKVEQLTEIVKERHDQGETYGEIATTLISTISSVFHLKTVSPRLKSEARPRNPMKFYDRLLFSCLLLGEQSKYGHRSHMSHMGLVMIQYFRL